MKKKLLAVMLSLVAVFCLSTAAFATAAEEEPATTSTAIANQSPGALGMILRAFLGDAADNLTNTEIGNIAKALFGDFDISALIGSGGTSAIQEIIDYINAQNRNKGGNDDVTYATRPSVTTTEPTTEPTTEAPRPTMPATTSQQIINYYYIYDTTAPARQGGTAAPGGTVGGPGETVTAVPYTENTTNYQYVPPETIYTDLLTPGAQNINTVVEEETSGGVTIKTILGIIILLGSGAAVVILLARRRVAY